MKIEIKPSATADTRTCDFSSVSKQTLLNSSVQHIGDVRRALGLFQWMLGEAAIQHDEDKITDIDGFHADFLTGFEQTSWWDRHRRVNRHHLTEADGIPDDVNLIDVLDFIADCVMAGMARSGKVRPLEVDVSVLMKAFQNTADLLEKSVILKESEVGVERLRENLEDACHHINLQVARAMKAEDDLAIAREALEAGQTLLEDLWDFDNVDDAWAYLFDGENYERFNDILKANRYALAKLQRKGEG